MRLLHILSTLALPLSNAYKVAIIGGGISGTFTAKYLAEYEVNHQSSSNYDGNERDCLLDEIVVYDVSPPPPGFTNDEEDGDDDISTTTGSNNDTEVPISKKLQSSSEPRPHNYQGQGDFHSWSCAPLAF